MLKRSSTPVHVAGSLNVGKMEHVATSAQSWSIFPPFSWSASVIIAHRSWIVARTRRSWGVAAGARSRAGNNGATRGVHATPVLSKGTPGALLNTEYPSWTTSGTDGGDRHPFLAAFEVVPYIGESATLGRSRLKAVIIRGIRHPSSLCSLWSLAPPRFFLPLLSFFRRVVFWNRLYPPPYASFSFSPICISFSPWLFLFKLRIPRVPLDFYLNVICILLARATIRLLSSLNLSCSSRYSCARD